MPPLLDYGSKKEQSRSKTLLSSKKQGSMKSDSEFYPQEEQGKKHSKKRSIRCCCLFHFPVSIVLMIVMLLCYDMYVAYTSAIQSFGDAWASGDLQQNWEKYGVSGTLSFVSLSGVFLSNLIVALVDIVFSLIGLAGVDLENAKLFMIFTFWKTFQFVYTVVTSAVIQNLIDSKKYTLSIIFTIFSSSPIFLAIGLCIQFYFLIYMYLYLNYMRKNRKHRHE
ncbi:hypothetical protein HMI54_002045 [Coelomomyces lativittatus]|nr:hypothetical protein HMI54_002045 [Coelomomyces lativittatus]KAJ1512417.1 hypothetical protein HMI55_006237 [Coelomomyces lativittatus]KAJ1513180.1 hypothetical protein HMI56_002910 [Coelomomyces lativittatus]